MEWEKKKDMHTEFYLWIVLQSGCLVKIETEILKYG
jgi:hypothetical protein